MTPRNHEHYELHVEMWPGDDPIAAFSIFYEGGRYTAIPGIEVGPFDGIAEVMRKASERTEEQLSLW